MLKQLKRVLIELKLWSDNLSKGLDFAFTPTKTESTQEPQKLSLNCNTFFRAYDIKINYGVI